MENTLCYIRESHPFKEKEDSYMLSLLEIKYANINAFWNLA